MLGLNLAFVHMHGCPFSDYFNLNGWLKKLDILQTSNNCYDWVCFCICLSYISIKTINTSTGDVHEMIGLKMDRK